MCLQQIPEPLRYWCWTDAKYVEGPGYEWCKRSHHGLEPEGFEEVETDKGGA